AARWTGTAASVVDLHPAGYHTSVAWGAHNGQQVGSARNQPNDHAVMWTGTAASAVILHPPSHNYSQAYGTNGVMQVGYSGTLPGGGDARACRWSGTPASWESLHPVEATASWAAACDENQIVGAVDGAAWIFGEPDVNLTPTTGGHASGVHSGQQVGVAVVGGEGHASLWTGSAESWVDLHPQGLNQYSEAYDVFAGRQVGYSGSGAGTDRAILWYGTAQSAVVLHDFLTTAFVQSRASGVWVDGDRTYVSGWGRNQTIGRYEAVMWVSQTVAPASFSMIRGTVFSGNLASLLNSDNNRLVMRPGFVFSVGEPPVQVRFNGIAPTASPNGFSFSVESSASFGSAEQKVWLWNYVLGGYELLDTRLATTTDDVVTVTVRTNPSRFIQPGTLAIRALVSYRAIGPAFAYPWSARVDKVWWTFPG
nr:hypothetical protein [Armatimonadota bacterium]